MANDRISEHPATTFHRELEKLKLRVDILERQQDHTTKALIAMSQGFRDMHDLTVRIGRLVSSQKTDSDGTPPAGNK